MHKQLLGLLSIGVLMFAGCGSGRETHPVTGKVAFADGTPLVGARVVFDSQAEGVSAQGFTNEMGVYTLTTEEDGDGAAPGAHRVIVMPPPSAVATGQQGETAVFAKPTGKPLLPKKYQRYETSGLTYDVKSGDNTFDIVIEKS